MAGGGSSASNAAAGGTTVTGTLASGNPIVGATITLKDSANHSTAASSVAGGSFTLTTTGFTPPYILQATNTGAIGTLYSVSADSNTSTTINITPLTDIITRSWYNVQGVSTDTAFAAPATYPAPAPAAVQNIQTTVQNTFGLWLTNASVPAGTNLISTAFTANSTGVDAVLDEIQAYAPPTASAVTVITINKGTTTEAVNLSYGAGAIGVTTATSGVSGSSSSATSSVVPTTTAQQTALTGITATLTNFGNTVTAKGSALAVADLMPYLDPNLLNDGENATQYANNIVSSVSSATVTFQGLQIKSLTSTTADVLLSVSVSSGGNTQTQNNEWFFKLVSGTWLISGDNLIAKVSAQAEMRTSQGSNTGGWNTLCGTGPQSTANPSPDVNLDVEPISGVVSGATVQDAYIWTSPCSMLKNSTMVQNGLDFDHYVMNSGALTSLPPAGTPYTFVLTTSSGTPASYTYTLPINAWTTDPISFTSPTGNLAANYAISNITFNSPLTANWTLPTTYQIARVQFEAGVGTSTNPALGFSCSVNGPLMGTTSTSGTITIPSTCNGLPVVLVTLQVSTTGVNGERSYAMYTFQ